VFQVGFVVLVPCHASNNVQKVYTFGVASLDEQWTADAKLEKPISC